MGSLVLPVPTAACVVDLAVAARPPDLGGSVVRLVRRSAALAALPLRSLVLDKPAAAHSDTNSAAARQESQEAAEHSRGGHWQSVR